VAQRSGIALQGGGAHGAFAWGVLDRLLDEVKVGRFEIAAVSGTSAGALNAAALTLGLLDNPNRARDELRTLWERTAGRAQLINPLVMASGLMGIEKREEWNVDDTPLVAVLEMIALRISPYDWGPFYWNPLAPIIESALPGLDRLKGPGGPELFICATRIRDNRREVFRRPHIDRDVLLASACKPTDFQAIEIGGERYWDGGYMGNPALDPLFNTTGETAVDDIVLIQINPLRRSDGWPISATRIADRLNQITFNASLVLEVNTIHTVNKLLEQSPPDAECHRNYRPIRLHAIANETFMQTLGVMSKFNPYWPFLKALFEVGRTTADRWLDEHGDKIGRQTSWDIEDVVKPKLRIQGASKIASNSPAPNPEISSHDETSGEAEPRQHTKIAS
jgi:NTE family protein